MNQIKAIQSGLVYNVSFDYDPEIVALIKQVPGRNWLPNQRAWAFPSDKLGFFLNMFKGTKYENCIQVYSQEDLGVNAEIKTTTHIPDIDISNIPFYIDPDEKPYEHQLDFMKYGIAKSGRGFIVGDDMRMGKTAEVLNIAEYGRHAFGYKHCLVICCVNTSKYNWMNDIHTHLHPYEGTGEGYILGTRKVKRRKTGIIEDRYDTGGKEKLEDLVSGHMYGDPDAPELPYFLITNIESIRYVESVKNSKGKKGKKVYKLAEQIVSMIRNREIGMIAIDEVHLNTSPTSSQGKVLIQMKRDTGTMCQWLPMTGTILKNKPTDAFLPMFLVDGHNFKDYHTWCKYFCVYGGYGNHDIIAYKNIPALSDMLSACMIRRRKEDVHDMPGKIQIIEYVENTPTQKDLYENIVEWMLQNSQSLYTAMNPMAKFLRLRQVNGSPELIDDTIKIDKDYIAKNAKIQKVLDLLTEIVDTRNEKVIIYSNWVEPLRTLYKFISKKYKVCCYTGSMKDDLREKHKRVFVNNPEYKVMIGTIGALGTAHTLTVAENVIFYDEPWVPTDREQAEDRIYGLNTTKPKNIYTIMTKDTVDERVHNILYTKDTVAKFIVDGKLDIRSNPDLFFKLLGTSSK